MKHLKSSCLIDILHQSKPFEKQISIPSNAIPKQFKAGQKTQPCFKKDNVRSQSHDLKKRSYSKGSYLYYYRKLQGDTMCMLASGESKSIKCTRKRLLYILTIFTYPFHTSQPYTLNLTVKRYLFNPYSELGSATALITAKRGACDTALLKFYTSTHFPVDLFVCLLVFLAQTIDTIPVTGVFLLLAGTPETKMGTILTTQGINSVR